MVDQTICEAKLDQLRTKLAIPSCWSIQVVSQTASDYKKQHRCRVTTEGLCKYVYKTHTATIYLNDVSLETLERILTHELVHLHLAPYQNFATSILTDPKQLAQEDILIEVVVNNLVKALL